MALVDSVVRLAVGGGDKEDDAPTKIARPETSLSTDSAYSSSASDVSSLDLIHSVVKMAVDDDDVITPPVSRSASPYTDSSSCDEDYYPRPSSCHEETAKPSYFNELFPRLGKLDKGAWLRAWPKFGSSKSTLLRQPYKYARASAQYEHNLKMYEWDFRAGDYVNKDLRLQDKHQKDLEQRSSLYDQQMYKDYYGRAGHNIRRNGGGGYNRSPANHMDLIEWNVRVKHGGKDDNDLNIALYDHHIPSYGREREKLNLAQLKMAVDMVNNPGGSKSGGINRDLVSSASCSSRFRPLPPSPMMPRYN